MASSLSPERCPDDLACDCDEGLGQLSIDLQQKAAQSTSHSSSSNNVLDEDQELQGTEIKIRKIFVGNLNTKTSTKELTEFFSRFGRVQNAHYARKKDGSREHFGFVTFYEPDDARKALTASQSGGLKMNGKYMVVNKAALKHQPTVLKNGKIMWTKRRSNWSHVDGFSGHRHHGCGYSTRNALPILSTPNTNDLIDESKCVIHLLNDDCLIHVFSFLSNVDRIKSERVCKRWQTLCVQMWLSTKSLNFEWLSTSGFGIGRSKHRFLNTNILSHVLHRCGPNLGSLDISYKYTKLREKALSTIVNECPNLKCLNLTNFCISTLGISILKTLGGTLRRLVLESTGNTKETHLKSLFQLCPNLNSVVLSNNSHLTGDCLSGLNCESLQELIMDSCNGIRAHILSEVFVPFKNLERLSMNACISITSGMLESILKSVPQLKSLSLSMQFPLLRSSSFTAISHLANLVTLTVCHNPFINDQTMKAISKKCKNIETLDITGCSVHTIDPTLSNAGIVFVAQLPKLVNLKISYMATLDNDALITLAEERRLKTLECRGTPTFTDAGICRLVELCNELELLDFSGCNHVSDITVHAAIVAVKLRTNNVKLKMITGATAVWLYDVKEPLLKIDTTDLSEDYHRPDYVDDVYFFSDSDEDYEDMDGIDQFDWECQSMFLGDDIGELIFANQFLHDSDDSDLDEELYLF